MRGLSIADQQMVEIARALASDSRLIIMDEPTAPLTPKEVETLFAIARRLRDEGRTIIFISHRLEEVRALCDRVTIFRDGNKIATDSIGNLSDADIIRLMIGRPLKEYMHKTRSQDRRRRAQVDRLTLPGIFEDISFRCARARSSALAASSAPAAPMSRAPSSASHRPTSGTISIDGKPVVITEPERGHRARPRLRPRGSRGRRHLPHAAGRGEHHRRVPKQDRAPPASSAARSRRRWRRIR
jgi:rhamnose transport system ATP-binding protein